MFELYIYSLHAASCVINDDDDDDDDVTYVALFLVEYFLKISHLHRSIL